MRKTTKSITAFWLRLRVSERHNIVVSEKHFKVIYQKFFSRVIERLADGDRFQMGEIGSVYISATSGKKQLTDWAATKAMWMKFPHLEEARQRVYHLSENTVYQFTWSRRRKHKFHQKFMYRMRVCKPWRKAIQKAIIEDKKEYT